MSQSLKEILKEASIIMERAGTTLDVAKDDVKDPRILKECEDVIKELAEQEAKLNVIIFKYAAEDILTKIVDTFKGPSR